jgi:hypothetical protein
MGALATLSDKPRKIRSTGTDGNTSDSRRPPHPQFDASRKTSRHPGFHTPLWITNTCSPQALSD